ncbi:MAG: ABC transporter ATP-binding protein [Verrucomicrobiota bacterium]
MVNEMIELKKIYKLYGQSALHEVEVLKGIDLEVKAETCISIRGASGSGKSTLLNVIGGLDRQSKGDVLWRGEKTHDWNRKQFSRWRNHSVGFVFQSYHLLPELTALENVMLPGWFGRKQLSQRAQELLSMMGLDKRQNHRPQEMSGGEQQRVAIARALINDPEIILADEPTGNLDRKTGDIIVNLLLDLVSEKKKALLLVTHDEQIANRMSVKYELSDGVLVQLEE